MRRAEPSRAKSDSAHGAAEGASRVRPRLRERRDGRRTRPARPRGSRGRSLAGFLRDGSPQGAESWTDGPRPLSGHARLHASAPVDLVLAEFASLNNLADRRDLPRVLEVGRARAGRQMAGFCSTSTRRCRCGRSTGRPTTGRGRRRSGSCSAEASRQTGGGRDSTSIGLCPREVEALWRHVRESSGTSAGPTRRSGGHCGSRASTACGTSTESRCARGCRTSGAGRMRTLGRNGQSSRLADGAEGYDVVHQTTSTSVAGVSAVRTSKGRPKA